MTLGRRRNDHDSGERRRGRGRADHRRAGRHRRRDPVRRVRHASQQPARHVRPRLLRRRHQGVLRLPQQRGWRARPPAGAVDRPRRRADQQPAAGAGDRVGERHLRLVQRHPDRQRLGRHRRRRHAAVHLGHPLRPRWPAGRRSSATPACICASCTGRTGSYVGTLVGATTVGDPRAMAYRRTRRSAPNASRGERRAVRGRDRPERRLHQRRSRRSACPTASAPR